MNILGINGWNNWFHDTSASLIIKGKLVACCEEERFTRVKHTNQPPINAVNWCLKTNCLNWDDIDLLCVGWDLNFYGALTDPPTSENQIAVALLRDLGAPEDYSLDKIYFVKHHVAHAFSVTGLSPVENGLVIIVDGQGEKNSISIFRYKESEIYEILALGPEFSLGYFYEAASYACGFGLTGTGKFMGLASYGKAIMDFFNYPHLSTHYESPATECISFLADSRDDLDDAVRIVDGFWVPWFNSNYGALPELDVNCEVAFDRRNEMHKNEAVINFAASVQDSLEKAIYFLIKNHISIEDRNVFIAGGVGLNCKNNGVLKTKLSNEIVVQPLSNDAGVSLGASLYIAHLLGTRVNASDFPFIGPEFSDKEILDEIISNNLPCFFSEKPWEQGANFLEKGKVIGWFQGKAEVGPRALGARSILARPDSVEISNRINQDIKRREKWRPFSPSVLEEHAIFFFEGCHKSPYMLFGYKAIPDTAKQIFAGTIHIDETARVQTVPKDSRNCFFRLLLEKFYENTNIPGVLNTSFNAFNEPIVCTPADAISTFLGIGLDALIIGPYIIVK